MLRTMPFAMGQKSGTPTYGHSSADDIYAYPPSLGQLEDMCRPTRLPLLPDFRVKRKHQVYARIDHALVQALPRLTWIALGIARGLAHRIDAKPKFLSYVDGDRIYALRIASDNNGARRQF